MIAGAYGGSLPDEQAEPYFIDALHALVGEEKSKLSEEALFAAARKCGWYSIPAQVIWGSSEGFFARVMWDYAYGVIRPGGHILINHWVTDTD